MENKFTSPEKEEKTKDFIRQNKGKGKVIDFTR